MDRLLDREALMLGYRKKYQTQAIAKQRAPLRKAVPRAIPRCPLGSISSLILMKFSIYLQMMKSSTRPLPSQSYQMMFPKTARKTTLPTKMLSLTVSVMLHWGQLLRLRRLYHLDSYSIHRRNPTTEMGQAVMMMTMTMTVQCLRHRHQSPPQLQMRSPWSPCHLPAFNVNKITPSVFWRRPNPAARTIHGLVRDTSAKMKNNRFFDSLTDIHH